MKAIKRHNIQWNLIQMVTLFSFLILVLSKCEKQENFKYKPSNTNGGKIEMTAWEFIQQKDSFSLMEEAVKITQLQDYYSGDDSDTYIIPTNTAFRNYLSTNGYAGISGVPIPVLKNILLYHIVKERVLSSDIALVKRDNPTPYETYNGQQMYLSYNNNYQLLINENTSKSWTIEISNIEPTNGVIHISPAVVYFSAKIPASKKENNLLTYDTIYVIQDSYINGGTSKNTNYGTDNLLKVKNVDGDGSYDRRSFLMFNLKDIKSEGNLRKAVIEVGVNFTHGKGLKLSLFNVPDTTWLENALTWNNAPVEDPVEIAHIITSKVPIFQWDCTQYISQKLKTAGRISIKIDGEAGGNETDEFYSTRNTKTPHPRLIATFSSGNSNLAMGINKGLTISKGGIAVLNNKMLEMNGAAHADIIYTLESVPSNGWLINGATILKVGSKFTQLDIDANNLVYVHNGVSVSMDSFSLSVKDPDGGNINPFTFEIKIQ